MRRAFEDAGDGRGTERGGNENCGAREGELADVRRRCRKMQQVSRWRVERRRWCDKMKRRGQGWTQEAANLI